MGSRIHVRVDPDRDRRCLVQCGSPLVNAFEFADRLDVEHEDARSQGLVDFVHTLSHPGIDDPLRCETGRQSPVEFSSGDDIQTGPKIFKQGQKGKGTVGLG